MPSELAEQFITKLGMLVPDGGLDSHVKQLGCYRQGQGDSEGLYIIRI